MVYTWDLQGVCGVLMRSNKCVCVRARHLRSASSGLVEARLDGHELDHAVHDTLGKVPGRFEDHLGTVHHLRTLRGFGTALLDGLDFQGGCRNLLHTVSHLEEHLSTFLDGDAQLLPGTALSAGVLVQLQVARRLGHVVPTNRKGGTSRTVRVVTQTEWVLTNGKLIEVDVFAGGGHHEGFWEDEKVPVVVGYEQSSLTNNNNWERRNRRRSAIRRGHESS